MGRKASEPKKTANGLYRCWHPSLKRYVNLGTPDYVKACELQKSFYNVTSTETVVETPTIPIVQPSNEGGNHVTMINLDDNNDAINLIANLSNNEQKTTSQPQPTPPSTIPFPSIFSPPTQPPETTLVNKGGKTSQKGITPEQSAKIASGLKKIAVNTNIVIVGAAIQMFGVVPAPLDKEEIELLQLGWEMWLDEMFNKAKLKPVYLVIVGNIMIAISMYASGTRKPKEIKTQTAPGHEAPKSMHLVSPPRQTVVDSSEK